MKIVIELTVTDDPYAFDRVDAALDTGALQDDLAERGVQVRSALVRTERETASHDAARRIDALTLENAALRTKLRLATRRVVA